MTTRQILNRNSYVVLAAISVLCGASLVASHSSLAVWIAWLAYTVLTIALYFRLRPGTGSRLGTEELRQLIGSGVPVVVQLYSKY